MNVNFTLRVSNYICSVTWLVGSILLPLADNNCIPVQGSYFSVLAYSTKKAVFITTFIALVSQSIEILFSLIPV